MCSTGNERFWIAERIDHLYPEQFVWLVRRWPRCQVVFEACMNWQWLFEILEEAMLRESIVPANCRVYQ